VALDLACSVATGSAGITTASRPAPCCNDLDDLDELEIEELEEQAVDEATGSARREGARARD
jgi:hypothetical protein